MKIVLRRSGKIGSKVIRFFTRETWSHIGVSFDGKSVFHSDSKGCRLESLEGFSKDSEVLVIDYRVSTAQMHQRAVEKVGSSYDFLGVIGFGLILAIKWAGIKTKMPLMNPKWMFCSEYAEYILFGECLTRTPGEVWLKMEKSYENQV